MSEQEHKPYSSKRWTDIPKAYVIGHEEISEEERLEKSKDFFEFIKRDQERLRKLKKEREKEK